jgi:hypothetical protein
MGLLTTAIYSCMDTSDQIKKPRKKRVLSKSLSAIKKREDAKMNKVIVKPPKKRKQPYVYNGKYLPYDRAKKVVKVLSLSSRFAYADWYAQHQPDYLPKRPDRAYKKEFEGWIPFLGKTPASSNERLKKIRYYKKIQEEKQKQQERETRLLKKQVTAYVKYEMRQAEVQANKLKRMEKTAINKQKKVEKKIKKRMDTPVKVYKQKKIDPSKYMDYESAKAIVTNEKLKNFLEYKSWWDAVKPEKIPRNPYKVYEGFNLYDFLGTERLSKFIPVNNRAKYRPYEEAVKFTRTLGIHSIREWSEFAKSTKCPKDIPRFPNRAYRYNPNDPSWGKWLSWEDWLGKDANLRIEAYKEQQKVLIIVKPSNAPDNAYSFVYKSGTEYDIDNFIDENELYVIRIYQIETFDWTGYLSKRFSTYMGEPNTFLISNIHQVLFDLDEYMTRIL